MLNRSELANYQHQLGFTIWQIERDYLQHIFLLFLSRRMGNELAFKGGTALQKAFGLPRFSIDLDFTQQAELPQGLFLLIEKDLSDFGCKAAFSEERKKDSRLVKFALQGPLYEGTPRTLTVLRIEISLREHILLEPDTKEIIPIYPDVQPYLIKMMKLEEILAEKVRAIFTRAKARDIFDLSFLLAKKIALKESLVNQKLGVFGIAYSKAVFIQHLKKVKSIWKNELSQLLQHIPSYEEIIKEIKEKI